MVTTTAQTPYMQLLELLERVPVYARPTVEQLRDKAVGYVWGWQDALLHYGIPRDSQESFEFGVAYGIHACHHELAAGVRYPIQDCWQWWREGKHDPAEWRR